MAGAHRPFKKGKKKKKRKKVLSAPGPSQTTKKLDKSKAECFFCKKLRHWKRNCPLYKASLDPNRPNKKKK